jgi:hypothetical protein
LTYIINVQFDDQNHPVILYVTSKGYAPGSGNDPRTWRTARWTGSVTGSAWEIKEVTTSDHNYDKGDLSIDEYGAWRIIGPTGIGPQPYMTGGINSLWTSVDKGGSWSKIRTVGRDNGRSHTNVRLPLNAHPDFYGFWADGDAYNSSGGSHLFFSDKEMKHVWQLPAIMTTEFAKPNLYWSSEPPPPPRNLRLQ